MIEQTEEKKVMANSANYFMLPMLQLNKSSFGVGNFINSYVDKSGYIVVDLNNNNVGAVLSSATYDHPQYVTDFDIVGAVRVVYQVPDVFITDLKVFAEGKYSQFSSELKVAISKYAKVPTDDAVIKCLNPQREDRQKIADDLGVRLELVKELLSAPNSSNFIKIK